MGVAVGEELTDADGFGVADDAGEEDGLAVAPFLNPVTITTSVV